VSFCFSPPKKSSAQIELLERMCRTERAMPVQSGASGGVGFIIFRPFEFFHIFEILIFLAFSSDFHG
jgi:hypothetical protein